MKTLVVLLAVVLAVIAQDGAPQCSPICTMEYDPICGVDAFARVQTFANPCAFNYYNCEHPTAPMRVLRNSAC